MISDIIRKFKISKSETVTDYLEKCFLIKEKSYIVIDNLINKFNYIIDSDRVINDNRLIQLTNIEYIDIYTNIILDDSLKKSEGVYILYRNKKYEYIARY